MSAEPLCVGITGHRVLADIGKLREGVERALGEIERRFPDRRLIAVSQLAEGADRLVTDRVLARPGAGLIAVPPLAEADYLEDFTSADSREEFHRLIRQADEVATVPAAASREQCYEAAGRHVLESCDLVLAVWDGEPARGPGGTAALVARARQLRRPVVWVHAGNRRPGSEDATSLGARQGRVTFENLEGLGIDLARRDRDAEAIRQQHRRMSYARFAVSLGPLAVMLLATQVLVFGDREHRAIAVALIALELAALATALCLAFLQLGRSHQRWIEARLRAEVLRREGFLLAARVGPYLTTPDGDLERRITERLSETDGDPTDPLSLLQMKDDAGDWRDALEDAGAKGDLPELAALEDSVRNYLSHRVTHQRSWFVAKTGQHARRARAFENGGKLMLMLALILAGLHLGLLIAGSADEHHGLHTMVALLALAAPAIGSALIGLQSVAGSNRLSGSYAISARALEPLERDLTRLLHQLERDEASGRSAEAQFRFKRAVLRTEALLSADLRRWWLVMEPEAPRPEA